MNVTELFEKSKLLGFENDEIDEVLEFLRFYDGQIGIRRAGVCGLCKERKTEQCPWPNQSNLQQPCCLTFKYKF